MLVELRTSTSMSSERPVEAHGPGCETVILELGQNHLTSNKQHNQQTPESERLKAAGMLSMSIHQGFSGVAAENNRPCV